ncbi:MAG: formylglycine-generating enzyme family protein [Nitrospirae bacterium]|nr:formylglycine-generating enzyme family protein [Nitrospirota bacterium]
MIKKFEIVYMVLFFLFMPLNGRAAKYCPTDGEVYPDSAELCGKHGKPLISEKKPEEERDKLAGEIEMVFVKGGCYQMGDTFKEGDADEKPVHEVCVDDFYIGKYEVSQGQWREVMGNNPSYFSSCGENCPVEQVSWNDVQKFIRKLNERLDSAGSQRQTYRLPTEAEWEYAAKSGGKNEKYAGGNDIGNVAWYYVNSGGRTHPVGQKSPNGLGVYDMSGNVWEWVGDWYGEHYYQRSPRDNPHGLDEGRVRLLRGGSWVNYPWAVRASLRFRHYPEFRFNNNGFRLLRQTQ